MSIAASYLSHVISFKRWGFGVVSKSFFFYRLCQSLCCEVCHRPPTQRTLSAVLLGKKRAWIPDEKQAYIEIEIRELSGDKVTVETKEGKVSVPRFCICSNAWKKTSCWTHRAQRRAPLLTPACVRHHRLWQWRTATSSRWILLSMTWSKTWPCWRTSMRRPWCTTCADATLHGWSMWVCFHVQLWGDVQYQSGSIVSCPVSLRRTRDSSVWPWIHTNGCQSTLPPLSPPTKASGALRPRHTSTPSQTMHTMTCCAVSVPVQ